MGKPKLAAFWRIELGVRFIALTTFTTGVLLWECRFSSAWSVLLQWIKRLPFFAIAILTEKEPHITIAGTLQTTVLPVDINGARHQLHQPDCALAPTRPDRTTIDLVARTGSACLRYARAI
jgi:hypothetical protein